MLATELIEGHLVTSRNRSVHYTHFWLAKISLYSLLRFAAAVAILCWVEGDDD